ncbi:MAG: TolC family protein [Candidatus Omnitrophica bacterium]|nr:TolC family protein [Candidatus Omnitrophota bacterium]
MTYFFRKHIFAFLLFFIPAFLSSDNAFSQDNKTVTLSLKSAIETALRNNKDIQIQEQEVVFARANIAAAQSRFFPAVSMGYGFTYNDAVTTTDSLPNNRKDTRIFYGYKSNNQAAFTGSQMIYDGGASIANLKEARVKLKIQEETLGARKLDIEFDAKRLYYGLLLAYETFRITQNLVDQAEAHYEDVLNRFEQGTSSKFDLLQSKVQISKVIPQLVKAKNAIDIIKADFKKLLYLDMKDDIALEGNFAYMPIGIEEEAFLNEAYRNSPQMKLRILGIDLNKWAIEFAKSGYYPNINAAGNYLYTSDKIADMFNPRHDNWNMGVSGTISIFDGMSTKAKVDEAKARYMQAVLSEDNIVEQIAVDIKRGCLDMKEAHAIILSQKDSIAEAKEALYISYVSYDNGVGINLDVIDAQVSLSQVEKNLASGIYDYIMAKAFIDKVMGREYLSFKEVVNDEKK